MHRLCHILLFLLPMISVGQNLAVNGSFEEIDSCDFNSGINFASGWTNLYPSQNSNGVDLFGPCSSNPNYSAPYHINGFQLALDGSNYAGFVSDGQIESPRGTLVNALEKDTVYMVEFFVNLWNNSGRAVAGMGLVFFESQITLPVESYDTIQPDISEPAIISDTLNWTKVNALYTAKGTEQYFAIGLFDTIVRVQTNFGGGAGYYFLDAVNIHKATVSEINGISEPKFTFSIYPNPATTNLTIESRTPLALVWVRDVAGRAVLPTLRVRSGYATIDVSGLPSGIYLVEALTQSGQRSVQKVVVE